MTVVWRLPPAILAEAGGERTLVFELPQKQTTVREALGALCQRYPRLCERIRDDQGEVRRHVNIFVGDEMIRFLDGLDSVVRDGAELTIFHAISGG